ncbi:methylthioribose kinase [Sulfurovum lithotrophicum]|uniref:S-methyl-5-thioribose kinase n=1 Tax=Sulfurovum lithotrophicum TaxID=206403 RepID=A0A7U4RQJ2_9BACT|nr:S-methyl-5-thioribose kinase [Sulfurovum lithotrophicum]AKF24885.1 methylthioribose kinase [Sulfurovum lithotrophicum]
MAYTILDTSNLEAYLFSLPQIKSFFNTDALLINEIGDGNLNFVFLVTSADDASKQLILKQAVPYLRCVGESYPLSKERMTYEIRSMERFSELSPHIPKIYHFDEEMSMIIMEYLGEHIIMRKGMIDGVKYPKFAEHISSFLAETLFKTSSLYLSSSEKRELTAQFIGNSELCKLTEDFVFTAPFMEHETNAELPELSDEAERITKDLELKTKILQLKHKFINRCDALIHGDLHTGSIMINEEETYVIDSEFAFVGPMGFDVGALIANLAMSWVSHTVLDETSDYADWILRTIEEVWQKFEKKFLQLWDETKESALFAKGFADTQIRKAYQEEYMLALLRESIGFAGCKIIRRQFGIAGVDDIRGIEDAQKREAANRLAIKIGERFIKEHNILNNINNAMTLIKA